MLNTMKLCVAVYALFGYDLKLSNEGLSVQSSKEYSVLLLSSLMYCVKNSNKLSCL